MPHPCRYKLCTSDWDPASHTASVNITLVATKDGIRDGDKQMLLAFEKLQAVGGGPYLDIFSNYTLQSTQVSLNAIIRFNPFAATLAAPSLRKRLIKVPNLKPLRRVCVVAFCPLRFGA